MRTGIRNLTIVIALLWPWAAPAAPLPWDEGMIEGGAERGGPAGAPTNQNPEIQALSLQVASNTVASGALGADMVGSLLVPVDQSAPHEGDDMPWIRDFLGEAREPKVQIELEGGRVIELSPDQSLGWAAQLLANGKRKEVRALAQAAIDAGGDKARAYLLQAVVALAEQRLTDARDAFFGADEAHPDPPTHRVNGLVVALSIDDAETRASALAELTQLAERDDPAGLSAQMALLGSARIAGDKPAITRWADSVLGHPAATWLAQKAALDNLLSVDQEQGLSATQQLLAAASKNPTGAFGLLRWMNAHGRAAQTLAWAKGPGKASVTAAPLSFAVAEAMVQLGQWEPLRAWLEVATWQNLGPLRDFLRAMTEGQGKTASGETWDRVIAEANPKALSFLLGLAEGWQWESATDALLWEIASRGPDPRPALRRLFGRYRSQRDAQGMRRAVRRIHEIDPDDWIAANNLAYLELLLDGDLALAGQLATANFQKRAENPAIAMTYAHYLLRSGRREEAIPLIMNVIESAPDQPESRLFQAIFLAETGNRDAAIEIANKLNKNDLLREEWALLEVAGLK